MKKLTLLIVSCFTAAILFAQQMPKKYVLLEHFTNSKCSVCASKNPAYNALIAQYPDDVRNLSIHPPVPYNTCAIYLSNPSQNSARTNLYGINGTPRVAVNGTLIPISTQLLPQSTLEAALGQESPIAITVEESGSAPNKTATITITSYGTPPAGNYRLFAAVAEKLVNFNSPNGETQHHDVFHAMLPDIDGQAITLPANGNSSSYTFNYTHTNPTGWTSNFNELYVLAIVQNAGTKEVLNTGTRFDPLFVSAGEAGAPQSVRIQPNPAREEALVSLPGETAERVEVYSISGSLVQTDYQEQAEQVRIPVATLNSGIYIVRITGKDGIYVGKMVKE